MPKCVCGRTYSQQRYRLGLRTCLQCGEKAAATEILAKSKRVAVAYNKGGLMYMGAPDVAQKNLQGSMNAQGRSVANLTDTSFVHGVLPYGGTVTGRLNVRGPEYQDLPRSKIGENVQFPSSVTVRMTPGQPAKMVGTKSAIGIAWEKGQAYYIYAKDDPRIMRAERHMFFEDGGKHA